MTNNYEILHIYFLLKYYMKQLLRIFKQKNRDISYQIYNSLYA